jgi:predicted ATPase
MKNARTNLTEDPTPFIGRTDDLESLQELVDRSRLVTVTGPPGAGKTRLAREFGLRCDGFTGGAWFCDVTDASTVDDVATKVAAALEFDLAGDAPAVDFVGSLLAERGPTLVILDNFEHLVDHGPETVSRWHDVSPETFFVVTSRETLRLRGERRLELAPLPDDEATDLFVERARAAQHDFDADADDVLGDLVERLDRLPLAIELAAARVTSLAPAEILRRLDQRFRLLRSPHRGRKRATLRGAIDWSWQLLDEDERSALAQLTVFRDGFDLDAAEAVVEVDSDAWIPDLLDALRHKSLLRATTSGETRYSMYESIAEFVRDQELDVDGVEARHAAYFTEWGRATIRRLNGTDGERQLTRLREERANIRAAYSRCRTSQPETAADLAAVLDALMRLVGPPDAHDDLLEDAVALDGVDSRRRADLLGRRADFVALQSDFEGAAADLDDALALAEEEDLDAQRPWLLVRRGDIHRLTGDPLAAVECLTEARQADASDKVRRLALAYEANCWIDIGDYDRARGCIDELQRIPESDDLRRECELLRRLAYVQFYLENVEEQRRLNERALSFARTLGDRRLEGICLQGLGDGAMSAGEYEDAIDAYLAALEIHETLANRTFEAMLLGNLGGAFHRCEQFDEARRRYSRSLEYHRVAGTRPYEGVVLFALGTLEFEQHNYDEARSHFRAALEVAEELDNRSDQAGLELCLAWTDVAQERHGEAAPHAEAAESIFEELGEEDVGWVGVSQATRAVVASLRGAPDEQLLTRAREKVADRGIDSQATIVAMLAAWSDALTEEDAARAAARAAAALETIRERFSDDDGRSTMQTALHPRLVAALIRSGPRTRAAGTTVTDSPQAPLVVGPECQWFQVGEERVDLRRRKSIRLILRHLVDRHTRACGEGTDVYDLFDVGWAGEKVDPEAGARRVYWAIRTLRKNGLDELLLTSDDGYLLDPDAAVARAPE